MSMLVALIWSCTGDQKPDSADDCPSSVCPRDECATSSTGAAAIDCCVATHGRGLTDEAATYLARICSGDTCDGALYLSEDAAYCAAHVHGLPSGIDGCLATFNGRDDAFAWTVENVLSQTCDAGNWYFRSGDFVALDAVSGAFIGQGEYHDD